MNFMRVNNEQIANMPKYTELGFKHMKIPEKLYTTILEQHSEDFKPEHCDEIEEDGVAQVINCKEVDAKNKLV